MDSWVQYKNIHQIEWTIEFNKKLKRNLIFYLNKIKLSNSEKF